MIVLSLEVFRPFNARYMWVLLGVLFFASCTYVIYYQSWNSAQLRLLNAAWVSLALCQDGDTVSIPCAWVKNGAFSKPPASGRVAIYGDAGLISESEAFFQWLHETACWNKACFGHLRFVLEPPVGNTEVREIQVTVDEDTLKFRFPSFRIVAVSGGSKTGGGLTATMISESQDGTWHLVMRAIGPVENINVTGLSDFQFLGSVPCSMAGGQVDMIPCRPQASGNFVISPRIDYIDKHGITRNFSFTLFSFPRVIEDYMQPTLVSSSEVATLNSLLLQTKKEPVAMEPSIEEDLEQIHLCR